jgi:hypothetical protein
MKHLLPAGIAISMIIASTAFAADMPLKAPAPSPSLSWTGLYIGGTLWRLD